MVLSGHEAIDNGLFRVSGEGVFFDDLELRLTYKLMQIISQEVSAGSSAMSVVYSEERALGPYLFGAMCWLHDIKNDRDSVFVIVPNDALVCICSISPDDSIPSYRALSRVVIRDRDLVAWL